MSIGMGVIENMLQSDSSKLVSLSNANVSEARNGTASAPKLTFKRRKIFAVRDFPPGCGNIVTRSTTQVVVDDDVEFAGTAAVEESNGVKQEPVDVQPLRVCLPDDVIDVGMDSVGGVRDFPSRTGTKCENSGSNTSSSSGTENVVKDMVVYADGPEGRIAVHDAGRRKAKKVITPLSREIGEGSRKSKKKKSLYLRESLCPDIEDYLDKEIVQRPQTLQIGLPPLRPSGSGDNIRVKVKETLRLYHGVCRKILQELEARPKKKGGHKVRVDYVASDILREKGKFLNSGDHIIGNVPGIEVGDEFQYRMELNILGIHKPSQGGIDYTKDGGCIVATSIVSSGGYEDELGNSDELIYMGQGGNVIKVNKKGKEPKESEDQQLITGNLALANSINRKNPVRVIRGADKKASKKDDARGKHYVYDGLYQVVEYWQETGPHGKLVFKYKLKRMPGQAELTWKVVSQSKKLKYREGLCRLDISEGLERLPICAVNEIDDEKPPMFIYTAKMIYPDWCRPIPPKGCRCTKKCAETKNCDCVVKNGGEIPYNHDGAVVDMKTLIYECGPLCQCPASCYLRVSQLGIKVPLEIFKTEQRGWGVRSLSSISSGTFICEYVGELLEDKEAESRTGNDEYLFDIGNRYDTSLAEELSKLMPGTQSHNAMEEDEETSGFTIDAAAKGNVGRFINHSCSPNLYAQNVLYDHEDKRIPHVMFFALDNIPPLQELCYDYNYAVDTVRDSDGNIKVKHCYCGAVDCTGRLY